jgi:hypothetical protein
MKQSFIITAVRAIAFALAAMYVVSAYGFIVNHQVSFISYTAQEPLAQWAVANLGARLFGIAIGFALALLLRRNDFLALMFAVRLTADSVDLWISTHTNGLDGSVGEILLALVAIEAACLAILLWQIKSQREQKHD